MNNGNFRMVRQTQKRLEENLTSLKINMTILYILRSVHDKIPNLFGSNIHM